MNAEKALSDYLAGSRPLTPEAFAKASGLTPVEAGRALQDAAARGRILQSTDKAGNGVWRRPSVMRSRPAPRLAPRSFQRVYQPGALVWSGLFSREPSRVILCQERGLRNLCTERPAE